MDIEAMRARLLSGGAARPAAPAMAVRPQTPAAPVIARQVSSVTGTAPRPLNLLSAFATPHALPPPTAPRSAQLLHVSVADYALERQRLERRANAAKLEAKLQKEEEKQAKTAAAEYEKERKKRMREHERELKKAHKEAEKLRGQLERSKKRPASKTDGGSKKKRKQKDGDYEQEDEDADGAAAAAEGGDLAAAAGPADAPQAERRRKKAHTEPETGRSKRKAAQAAGKKARKFMHLFAEGSGSENDDDEEEEAEEEEEDVDEVEPEDDEGAEEEEEGGDESEEEEEEEDDPKDTAAGKLNETQTALVFELERLMNKGVDSVTRCSSAISTRIPMLDEELTRYFLQEVESGKTNTPFNKKLQSVIRRLFQTCADLSAVVTSIESYIDRLTSYPAETEETAGPATDAPAPAPDAPAPEPAPAAPAPADPEAPAPTEQPLEA